MLNNALDYGITEFDFWEMTFSEIERAVSSKRRVLDVQAREKAYYDYTLANLITKGVARVLGDKSSYPTIEEAYPGLFEEVAAQKQAEVEEQKIILSALRFKQFAQSYNKSFKQEVAKKINE